MPFILTNPWGLLALLAIPVILLIHFLQRKAQVMVVSTMFLLPDPNRQARRGHKFDRLLSSLPLWLQLLIALLLTLLLTQPRVMDQNATIRVAVVLDSSASMSVFKEQATSRVQEVLTDLQQSAPNIELWVLESDISRARLYHGNGTRDLEQALEEWNPNTGAITPSQALRVARSLAGSKGAVVYITDTPLDSVPYGASMYSVGEKVANVGFTGVSYKESPDGIIWEASVKNYSDAQVTTQWTIRYDNNTAGKPISLTLKPDEVRIVRGGIPPEIKRAQVSLEEDAFLFDNTLPLLPPRPKLLDIAGTSDAPAQFVTQLVENFDHLRVTVESPDLLVTTEAPDSSNASAATALVFLSPQERKSLKSLKLVREDHPLTEGLNWQSLLVNEEPRIQATDADEVLLWGGDDALIMLRTIPADQESLQLIFNFSLQYSNALQQESFVLLLYRYLELLRDRKNVASVLQTELNQKVTLQNRDSALPLTLEVIGLSGDTLRTEPIPAYSVPIAPQEVGFFRVSQSGTLLMTASNLFADTREADLRACKVQATPSALTPEPEEQLSDNSLLWRFLLLLSLGALLLSWAHPLRRNSHLTSST